MSHEDELTALPLSFAQERLWFLDQLIPGSPAYTIFDAVRLEGPLDLEALRRSISELVSPPRGPALDVPVRLRPASPGRPAARAARGPTDRPSFFSTREAAGRARPSARRRGRATSSLTSAPLLTGLPLSAGGRGARADSRRPPHRLRRLVGRGASRELAALYAAFRRGERCSLPEPALQYADYAVWQREWLPGHALQRAARLLARAARRRSPPARPAHRPAASGGPAVQGPPAPRSSSTADSPPPSSPRPQPGRHPLHDAAGRLPGPAAPLLRAGRRAGRLADRRPRPRPSSRG